MTQVSRICKYGCNTQLGQYDTNQNKYLETDGTLHTRERCESLKSNKDLKNGRNEISLDLVLVKLAKIGVQIDLERLKNV
jgi:hypothetical protein